jgi:hypothetical protein
MSKPYEIIIIVLSEYMFNYNLPIKYYSMSLGYLLTFHHHEISLQHADYVVIASWPAYIDSYLLPILLSCIHMIQ